MENNVGIAIAEEMTKTHIDEFGETYPAYGFINDKEMQKTQPKDAIVILYGIKANAALNSAIHGNVYARLNGGMVKFLIKEQEAKSKLLSTQAGKKMTPEERIKRLLPHEMTTRLFNEMANLRLKKTGSANIELEKINTRYPKDKYSSFSYGLWRIKELEDEYVKKKVRRGGLSRKLVFYTG